MDNNSTNNIEIENNSPQPVKKNKQKQKNTFPYRSTIGLFKSSLIAHICGCIGSLFITIYFSSFKSVETIDGTREAVPLFKFGFVVANGQLNPVIGVAIFFASLFLTSFFVYKIVNFEFKKITAVLWKDCDVFKYITIYSKFTNYKLHPKQSPYIYCCLANGYIANGDFEIAIETLEKIDIKNKKVSKLNILVCYNNLMLAYLFLNRFEESEKCLENIKNLKEKFMNNSKLKNYYDEVLDYANIRYNIIANRDISHLQYLKDRFDKKPNMYDKIMAKHFMSIIYKNMSDEINVQNCYKYIIDNGKDLFVAKLAIELH